MLIGLFEAPVIVEDPCNRWNADRGGHGRDLDGAVARWTLHETAGMDVAVAQTSAGSLEPF